MELYENLRTVDWTLPTETVFLTDWPHRLWNIDKPHNWIGGSGAQGVGYNAPAALGAALANKGTGRITAAIVGDGEMMMTNQTLWTAAQYQIPILYLVHNNRAYHMEIMHTGRMAMRRSRDTQRRSASAAISAIPTSTTRRWRNRWACTARGRSTNPNDLGPAISARSTWSNAASPR